jgi:integrase
MTSSYEQLRSSHSLPSFGARMKFTVKTVERLQLPAGKADHIEWDDDLPGFGIRLRNGGSRNWVFQYALGDKQRRMSIGSAKGVSLVKARETASELHAKVRLGQDPAGQKSEGQQRAAETFEAIGRKFLAFQKGELRPDSYRHIERHILKYAKKLHSLQLAALNRRTIVPVIDAIHDRGAKVTANRFRSTLSHFFSWSMEKGYIDHNPLIGLTAFEEKPRDRTLTDGELREIWAEAGDDHYGSIVKLLMLTGQRADEMASLRRSEINKVTVQTSRINGIELPAFDILAAELPSDRTKNKRPHIVPLSDPALAILKAQPTRANDDGSVRDLIFGIGQLGFSGWSRCKERLDDRIHAARVKAWQEAGAQGDKPPPLPHWTPHDLRRTMDTAMNDRLGIAPHVVEAILNHVSSTRSGKSGVAAVYNKALYLRERHEALRLWADHLMAVVGAPSTNAPSQQRAA